jgi:hypothetical protein
MGKTNNCDGVIAIGKWVSHAIMSPVLELLLHAYVIMQHVSLVYFELRKYHTGFACLCLENADVIIMTKGLKV